MSFHLSPRALSSWNPQIVAAERDSDRSIGIYDPIGADYYTGEGVTAKRIAAALRAMGKGPVVVNINSPGGDLFEGLAIYNLLRDHPGEVTVKVLGVAASAASIIAMAGDKVQIAKSAFFMVHNAWVAVVGNRNDLSELAKTLEGFDAAMAGIYSAKTGMSKQKVAALMDAESWIGGDDAIEHGFADELIEVDRSSKAERSKAKALTVRRVESALRAAGLSKSEAVKLIAELKSSAGDPAGGGEGEPTPAIESGALSAAAELARSLTRVLN
jgi:ATP-dependent protease ClpP protease subunit